jgi:hypothetical protein
MWVQAFLGAQHLPKEGDERIKQDYLVPTLTGDKIGCLVLQNHSVVVMWQECAQRQ